MKSRSEIAAAWWLVLTLIAGAADLFLYRASVALWAHHAWLMAGAYRAAGATPGATLLALARTLSWAVVVIPVLSAAGVGGIWWSVARRGNDNIQRGSRVVDADQGARIAKQRRQ